MDWSAAWLANVVALLALLGSAVGFIVTRRDAKGAEHDAAEARRLADRSADAAERSAAAQEQMARAFDEFLTRQERRRAAFVRERSPAAASWVVRHLSGARYELRNEGSGAAHDVTLVPGDDAGFRPPTDPASEWPAGSARTFSALGSLEAGPPSLTVRWRDAPDAPVRQWSRPFPAA